ncbi:hypothetical protein [Streptomyces alboflavus]|uniref:hypothetical protein n=1 Tax=Streptomyces alboflavus TaxID=67267 RepID=UPI0004BFA837|nr:hypothetical protein [Streptomyces alboflavus]
MGIRLFVEVLDHAPETLTWRERYALAVLAENANDSTRECWPGIEDDPAIAHRMRLPGRSSRYEVIKALRKKGALEGVSAGHRGRRAVYRIPALRSAKGPGSPDPIDEKGSGNPGQSVQEPRTQSEEKGPETSDPMSEKGSGNDPERVREPHGKGPETPDPFPSVPSVTTPSASKQESQPPAPLDYGIPEAARPLIDSLTAAGVIVRWPFKGNQWFPLLALIEKTGVPALVAHAIKAAGRAPEPVDSAKYFLRGWSELPPMPAPDTERPPLRAVSGGYQPYREPTPEDRASDLGHF